MRFNRRTDYQRVLSKDLDAYNAWFRLVRNTISKYGIINNNIYNFNETRFIIRQISLEIVVISSKRQNRPYII